MATETVKSVRVNVKLENGTDNEGNTVYVDLPLGNINKNTFNANRVISIVSVLEPCITRNIFSVEKITTSTISP